MTQVKKSLDMMVSAAIGAMLVGRDRITLDEAERAMPEHIRAARPSHKSIAKALVASGWEPRRMQGHVVYLPASIAQADTPDEGARGIGDNGSADQLRLLVERIERLREEKKALSDDEKDVMAEAMATGFDLPALRAVLRLRKMEKHSRDEADALIEMYRGAMGV